LFYEYNNLPIVRITLQNAKLWGWMAAGSAWPFAAVAKFYFSLFHFSITVVSRVISTGPKFTAK
jgi:hypothetical protein